MDNINIDGVLLTPLKKIFHPQGDVYHGIKKSDPGFKEFGEAYFSTISFGEIKPWKKHLKMTLNLVVPSGTIRFILYDDRAGSNSWKKFMDITLSLDNYFRLTVPPGIWMAFQGIGRNVNLLLNLADIEHDPGEIERLLLEDIPFNW